MPECCTEKTTRPCKPTSLRDFDLEAAKRGDRIVVSSMLKDGEPAGFQNADFVGVMKNGHVVYENKFGIGTCSPRYVFMAPKTRTVWRVSATPKGALHSMSLDFDLYDDAARFYNAVNNMRGNEVQLERLEIEE